MSSSNKMRVHFTNRKLRSFAKRIKKLIEANPDLQDSLDYALGALHGLALAKAFEYDDRTFRLPPSYKQGLFRRAIDLSEGRLRVGGKWAAGFYFNSALARLDASYERILAALKRHARKVKPQADVKFPKCRAAKMQNVYDESNRLKHDPSGTLAGRTVSFKDAVEAFGELLQVIERNRSQLAKK